jgi:CHAD domain-containing protein
LDDSGVKARRIELDGVDDPHELVSHVLQTRLHEARLLAVELERRDPRGLHDFRIACKRLRYALERFESLDPSLESAAEQLGSLQDSLGEAHDRDVLLAMLANDLVKTRERLQRERDDCVDRASELWKHLEPTIVRHTVPA